MATITENNLTEPSAKYIQTRRVWRCQRVIRICKLKNRQHNGQKKGQKTIYQTLHRKRKIEQHKPH
jgi:hypothetical protein